MNILDETPVRVENRSLTSGRGLVDLARIQMITHGRDLYAFMHADPADVRVFSYDPGLQFVGFGLKPERRSLLEAMYIFLIMRNGMPIGYTQAVTLYHSVEINFNVFDTYRGIEASRIFLYTLALARYLFHTKTFIINTQQLGEGNVEALQTGAFWFYYKHGFRPQDLEVQEIVQEELQCKQADRGYRCSRAVLKKLARSELHLFPGASGETVVTDLPTEGLGLAAGRYMETCATGADPLGEQTCVDQCTRLLGVDSSRRLTTGERIAWQRWSPVVLNLPGIRRWGQASRTALADIIFAKGGQRESDFVLQFDRHTLLQGALQKLVESGLQT